MTQYIVKCTICVFIGFSLLIKISDFKEKDIIELIKNKIENNTLQKVNSNDVESFALQIEDATQKTFKVHHVNGDFPQNVYRKRFTVAVFDSHVIHSNDKP